MSNWQWKVIVAIVRTLMRQRYKDILAEDEALFEEVLKREIIEDE
jgi:hypothetical protein